MKMVQRLCLFFTLLCLSAATLQAQYSIYEPINIDEVEYSFIDFGTMWTFDDIPSDYFMNTYGYVPTEEWLEDARLSALQFGGGCSAAFVSEDGLIMTNHHCGRGALPGIQKDGEDLLKDGFYASTPEEERKINGLFVDQLIAIEDITAQVISAMEAGKNNNEKIDLRDSVMAAIVADRNEETGLNCKVITLYNGGKYSLYTYKRYNDIRLVMAPDFQIAATGWDWDNFTYPRYELDFAFYRAYDEKGKPVKSDNYFKWSEKGAEEGEPIFVIGRPGNTDRLYSCGQLEYFRDYTYPIMLTMLNELYQVYYELFKKHPERESELLNRLLGTGNGRKSYAGRLMGLKDDYLMAKKRDFEKQLIQKVKSDPELNSKYGHLWDSIGSVLNELKSIARERYSYSTWMLRGFDYMNTARKLIEYAEQMKLPEEERNIDYKEDHIEETRKSIAKENIDEELQKLLTRAHANILTKVLGSDNELVKKVYNGKSGDEAVEYAWSNSRILTKENIEGLLNSGPDEILNTDDPFINFILYTRDKMSAVTPIQEEAENTLSVLNQELGRVIFETYGNKISPDATSSLRISDGVIKGYEYNGTIAPGKVTYYGLWDRYNSFDKSTYPWGLHERWKIPPEQLDLSVPIGFASTNDIVGGNSGSSVINRNQEIVGLVHDGNLESLAGTFAYLTENNRTVATDSWGLMEALKYIYKTDRLVKELQNGKLVR